MIVFFDDVMVLECIEKFSVSDVWWMVVVWMVFEGVDVFWFVVGVYVMLLFILLFFV